MRNPTSISRQYVPLLLLLWLLGAFSLTTALVFTPPPNIRWALGQEEALRQECQDIALQGDDVDRTHFIWAPNIRACDYTLATTIFECLAVTNATSTSIHLPRISDDASCKNRLSRLMQVLNSNSHRLGNFHAESTSWPQTPATQVRLSLQQPKSSSPAQNQDRDVAVRIKLDNTNTTITAAIRSTEQWAKEKLCGMRLCPYTASMKRAAVGLESVGVAEGPIVIRHSEVANNIDNQSTATEAVTLSLSFWKGVTDLATLDEDEVATFLIVAPTSLDDDFVKFASIFDDLIEPSVQAVRADTIVGRALFHPQYNASLVGHDKVIAGHALPAKMVQEFVEQYAPSMEAAKDVVPDLDTIALANDAVRWTPHATINLLRRSQLTAAKDVEALSPTKRPNWIYAKNVLRMIQSQSIGYY